MLIRLDQLLL